MTPETDDERQAADDLAYWEEHLTARSFVYVLQGDPGTPIKIGVARNVRKRIRGLQTGNWMELRLLHVLPGGHDLERQLHWRAGYAKVIGEWFHGQDADMMQIFIRELARAMRRYYAEYSIVPDFRELLPQEGWQWATEEEEHEWEEEEKRRSATDYVLEPECWPQVGSLWLDGASDEDIAEILGVTVPYVARIYADMREQGGYELDPRARRLRDDFGFIPGRFSHRDNP